MRVYIRSLLRSCVSDGRVALETVGIEMNWNSTGCSTCTFKRGEGWLNSGTVSSSLHHYSELKMKYCLKASGMSCISHYKFVELDRCFEGTASVCAFGFVF